MTRAPLHHARPAGALGSEAAVLSALARLYPEPAFAFFPHVRNGTGYARKRQRTADALAMSLWPSRGLVLHGFEVKVSRGDWLTELADPQKADDMAAYCDLWWLAVGNERIVQPGELPPKWGLIAPHEKGVHAGTMRVVKEAEALDAKPLDRLLVASILREGRRGLVPAASVKEAAAAEVEAARAETMACREEQREHLRKAGAYDHLKQSLDDFERVSGIRITPYDGRRIGEAVRAMLEGGLDGKRFADRLREIERTLAELHAQVKEHADALEPQP